MLLVAFFSSSLWNYHDLFNIFSMVFSLKCGHLFIILIVIVQIYLEKGIMLNVSLLEYFTLVINSTNKLNNYTTFFFLHQISLKLEKNLKVKYQQ